jgi:hypothetical protein
VLWIGALDRCTDRCFGYDFYENGVFTGTLRAAELGWKHSSLESRACAGQSVRYLRLLWFLREALVLVVCSGDEHLWVGEVCGGDFSPGGHVRSCDYGRLVSIYYPAFLPCS